MTNKKPLLAIFALGLLFALQAIDFLEYKYLPYQLNNGLMFGFFGNNLMAISLSVLILSVVIVYIKPNYDWRVAMFATGIISNCIDRIIYGGVIDYISVWYIPKFNLADLSIVAGLILIALKKLRTI